MLAAITISAPERRYTNLYPNCSERLSPTPGARAWGRTLLSVYVATPLESFSFGIEPGQGPSLIFITLPEVFINMTGGRFWGTLFFLFMTFASFSTVTAVFENLVGSCMDGFKWNRKKAVALNLIFMLIASLPCVLGYNLLSDVHLIGGRDILDSEDFLVSNLILPIGALLFVMFCVSKQGWGADNYFEEVNSGKGMKMSQKLLGYYRYVLPVLILIIFINGLK